MNAPYPDWTLIAKIEQLERQNRRLQEALCQGHRLRAQWQGSVSELRATKAALQQSRQLLDEILQRTPEPVLVLSARGNVLWTNQAFDVLSGVAPDKINTRRLLRLLAPVERRCALDVLRLLAEGVNVAPQEHAVQNASGDARAISTRWTGLYDPRGSLKHIIVSGVDVTERRRAEQALLATEARYRFIIEHMQDGLIVIEHGRLRFVNNAFAEMIGADADDLLGQDAVAFVAP